MFCFTGVGAPSPHLKDVHNEHECCQLLNQNTAHPESHLWEIVMSVICIIIIHCSCSHLPSDRGHQQLLDQ